MAAFAAHLASLGLERGDRVALFMKNAFAYPAALLGAFRGGYVAVPVNAKLHPRQARLPTTRPSRKPSSSGFLMRNGGVNVAAVIVLREEHGDDADTLICVQPMLSGASSPRNRCFREGGQPGVNKPQLL
jgi:hypothetical protein